MTLSSNSAGLQAVATKNEPANYRLLFLYSAPYFVYVAMGSLDSFLSITWIYILRLLVVPGMIIWAWRWYRPIRGPKSSLVSVAVGALVGITGTILWVSLITPFVKNAAPAWGNPVFYLRLAASSLVVPVFEEILMRGYVFHFVLQWDKEHKKGTKSAFDVTLHDATINDIRTVCWNVPAIILSTVAFTLGHQVAEWPAALAYGFLMALLLILRKDLLSCVVAHGITNFSLGVYVFQSGNWQYW